MTQKNKELLLKDLCSRLSYQVKVSVNDGKEPWTLKGIFESEYAGMMLILEPSFPSKDVYPPTSNWLLSQCKPYLRSLSSMTEEEFEYLNKLGIENSLKCIEIDDPRESFSLATKFRVEQIGYLYEHHYDVNGLIPSGCAIEVTEQNNPYKD